MLEPMMKINQICKGIMKRKELEVMEAITKDPTIS